MTFPGAGRTRGGVATVLACLVPFLVPGRGAAQATAAPPSGTTPPTNPSASEPQTPPSLESRVVWVEVRLSPEARDSLRRQPRERVRADVVLDGRAYPSVAIRVKGSRGSFRPIDDRPGLTLDFDRLVPGRSSPWGPRLHLNNGVEDPSLLHAWLGAELFRSAGVPTPRSGHAVLTLDGRRLGAYVLEEGVTPAFLSGAFQRGDGQVHDTDDTDADLGPLQDATAEPDSTRRWQRLGTVLDLDRFLTFLAMEVLLVHRDGYGLARNNFHIYHDPGDGRFHFLPHGMDQLLEAPDFPWCPTMSAPLARAVMSVPEGRRRYEARFRELLRTSFVPATLEARVRARVEMLGTSLGPTEYAGLRAASLDLIRRIHARHDDLIRQLALPLPTLVDASGGPVTLSGWTAVDVPEGGRLDRVVLPDVGPTLHIRAGPRTDASWRARVRLPAGRYRLVGRVRTAGVRPLPYGRGHGAMLRIAGDPRPETGLLDDTPWQTLEHRFEVDGSVAHVEVLCELRATLGEAWFDQASLRVEKVR